MSRRRFVEKGAASTNVKYAELDRDNKLRPCAAKEWLPAVATRHGHTLSPGQALGRRTFHYATSPGGFLVGDVDDYGGWSK